MEANIQKTVMIVQDSGIDRELLKMAIQKKYNVIIAENDLAAERILASETEISIILLDTIMPTTNGFEFLEWIQSQPEYRHIPIVFTGLSGTDENILKGLTLGVRDVFVKPYDLGQVLRSIDNLLTLADYQKNAPEEDLANQELHTVLIVDDSLLSRKILIETLRNQFKFMEATNGIEALEVLRTHKEEVSLVLLDMIMPKMDGYEFMKIAMAENLVENIPVVAVTSEEGQERYVRMLEAGIREVVKKPFSPLVVQGKFKNLIDLYHYGRSAESETVTLPKPSEEKSPVFSSGMFHLKFNQGWECVFVSDSCLELFKCTREEFLSALSDWKVFNEITGEEASVHAILQELSHVQESKSCEGDVTDEDSQKVLKIKSLFTSFLGEAEQMQIYGAILNSSDANEAMETNFFFSDINDAQEKKERMLCRYIIRGRRAIINSVVAKQLGIPDEIENFPAQIVNQNFITQESTEEWYRVFDEIDKGKPYGSCEVYFHSKKKTAPRRCHMEFTGMTDTDGNPSGALIYYELEQDEIIKNKSNDRSVNTLATMKNFYEIASINLTKGTCHVVLNGAGNQKGAIQDLSLDQVLQRTYQSVAPEHQESFKRTFSQEAQLAAIAKGQDEYSLTFLRRNTENKWVWVETIATRQYNPYDDDILVCIVSRMVDEQIVQEQLLLRTLRTSVEKQEGWEQYEALSARIFHGLAYVDYDDGRSSRYFIGTLATELGCSHLELALAISPNIPKEDRDNFCKNRKEALRGKEETFITHYRVKTLYGTWIWVSNTATRFKDKEGNEGYIYFLVDSTYEQTLKEQLRVQKKEVDALRKHVQTDQMSGTYTREYFLEKAQEMIDQASSDIYIVRLNIVHFRVINELHGTEKCDQLLWEIGQKLKALGQQEGFIVGRFAADRFYLCIRKEEFEQIDFVKKMMVSWLGMEISFTYGVCLVEEDCSVHVLCDRADMALSAKRNGETNYIRYYNEAFHQKLMQKREIESEMENALAERQFCIYIQPKFDVELEQVIGGEVLVRWQHPQKGLVPPGVFISVFEKNGFIRELDYYVWEESCRFLAKAKEQGLPQYPLSVNVSRIHFYGTALEQKWIDLLEKYRLDAKCIELEITESICDEDSDMIITQCKALQKLGFRISMDDFGSGYSSLNMLRKLPLDILKMDLKFLEEDETADLDQKMKGRDILRTQIELAHTIGLDVVVEGLETKEQKDFVKEIGSCAAQGYYYAKPMPASEYAEMIQSSKKDTIGFIPSEMSAQLRRERLRQEQLQPLLEVISASNTIFGYLLPEKEGVLSLKMAQLFNCSQRIPNLNEHLDDIGIFTPGSLIQCVKLLKAAEEGERSGATVVEYINTFGEVVPHWLRFDTILDYEGNPLIAMFIAEKFGDITAQVEKLIKSKNAHMELEHLQLKEQDSKRQVDVKALLRMTQKSFPEILVLNLTKMTYRMIQYDSDTTLGTAREGAIEDMIRLRLESVVEEDREEFLKAFDAKNIEYHFKEEGKDHVSLTYRRPGKNNEVVWTETRVYALDNTEDSDFYLVAASRHV